MRAIVAVILCVLLGCGSAIQRKCANVTASENVIVKVAARPASDCDSKGIPDQALFCPIAEYVESHLLAKKQIVRAVEIHDPSSAERMPLLKPNEIGIEVGISSDMDVLVVHHAGASIHYCWSALRGRDATIVTISPWFMTE